MREGDLSLRLPLQNKLVWKKKINRKKKEIDSSYDEKSRIGDFFG